MSNELQEDDRVTGNDKRSVILLVDDDSDLLRSVSALLKEDGHKAVPCSSGPEALGLLESLNPDLILLDISMPEMDGYEICRRIRGMERFSEVPVVFVTGRSGDQDRQMAFAVGASGYIQKPFDALSFLTAVSGFLEGTHTLIVLPAAEQPKQEREGGTVGYHDLPGFPAFSTWLLGTLPRESREGLLPPSDPTVLYDWGAMAGLTGSDLARRVSEFTGLPLLQRIQTDDLELGMLPRRFSLSKLVLPVRSRAGRPGLVMCNPFDWELWDTLEHTPLRGANPDILLAAPETIRGVFDYASNRPGAQAGDTSGPETAAAPEESDAVNLVDSALSNLAGTTGSEMVDAASAGMVQPLPEKDDAGKDHPVARLADAILSTAVQERASDIHIEPKPDKTLIRGRVDGDMVDLTEIPSEVSGMLVSRLKALAGMNIAERRKPQDGGMARKIDGRMFKLRLATTSTPHGESLVMRLLEPTAEPMTLQELGMTPEQEATLKGLASRSQGLILMVGPTGSGKSTTIYSLLSQIDTRRRSLMTVEDPVEYRIAFANQQEVREKAGVTFESLLRSAVRQDPDVLLLGEMRDLFSAKASMDFASSGHLTVTTMHSSNATTAIFRLERLGASRIDMSEALIGVVAQKLLKRLCPECKVVREVTPEEREMLAPYCHDIPAQVADAVGCPACRGKGYFGREGVYEILRFDVALAEKVRSGVPISAIRQFARDRGDFFISDHGIKKIRDLLVPVRMVYEQVLVEETVSLSPKGWGSSASPTPVADRSIPPALVQEGVSGRGQSPMDAGAPEGASRLDTTARPTEKPSILVVDDDSDIRVLLERFLTGAGFEVTLAQDGVDALLLLGKGAFDLILSDINMPNLDGLKLLEIVNQHGNDSPVVFLSAEKDPTVELQGLELGAADFIHKPIQKDVVLHRIRRVLER